MAHKRAATAEEIARLYNVSPERLKELALSYVLYVENDGYQVTWPSYVAMMTGKTRPSHLQR